MRTFLIVLAALSTLVPSAQTPRPAVAGGDNLAGLASGAIVAVRPTPADANGEAWFLLDDDVRTGWTSLAGHHLEPTVIELADRSVIRTVQFDTANDEWEGRVPKRVLVEMSDASATDGFKPIADVTLAAAMKDGQSFKTTADVPGRWLRLTVKTMQLPDKDIVQITGFHAFGERLAHKPAAPITGTYEINDGSTFHLKQEGTRVTGCNEKGGVPLAGGMDGRVFTFGWKSDVDEGPAVGVFGDAGMFMGFWKKNGAEPDTTINVFEIKKTSDAPGDCPNWHTQDALGDELKKTGRVRLYGINFDSDSDVLRPESKAVLDQLVATLKADAALKITIEGHTDSTSTAQRNQVLSERRAAAVKTFLVAAGIDGARLATAGFGATKPVATNDSAIGRAENRRVELVKQ
jgi:outer membrane protein OmpA-like peptidoglycan-associated protein